jgi:hypothetical protein
MPVWLQLDGRLRGAGIGGAAGGDGGGRDAGSSVEVRSVIDPRTGKGCGEAHGKMKRLLGDLIWKAVILGFGRARGARDGREGLLLIAERREGLEALAAAEAARRQAKPGKAEGTPADGGGAAASARAASRPQSGALKRRQSGASELGMDGEGRPSKAQRRAERIPVSVDRDSFWYSQVGVSCLWGDLCMQTRLSGGWLRVRISAFEIQHIHSHTHAYARACTHI